MTKPRPESLSQPPLVLERLASWGSCVRKQRIGQHIRAADLCARMAISRPTLQRLEAGNPGVSAAVYLTALHILGLAALAAPELPPDVWRLDQPAARARRSAESDDAYF